MPARLILIFASLCCLCACSSEGGAKLPGVYRIDVQQGNVIEQEMIDKLKPGMDKNQVRFIMGTPAVVDPFHTNRWEYLFTYSKRGKRREQRHITLYFEEEKLAYIEGDVVTALRKPPDDLKPQSAAVEVPIEEERPGFFSRLFNALPFVDDDEPRKKSAQESAQEEQLKSGPAQEGQVKEELPLP